MEKIMKLQGQTALVTGGSRGIGRAICLKLAEEGADIIINYRSDGEKAAEVARQCQEAGVDVCCIQADIADPADCDRMFDQVRKWKGRLDILVNNAGITRDGLILRMKEENFESVIDVNLKGTFFCMQRAAKIMVRQRYGRIISLSSVVGLRGNPGQVNYAAGKAGIIGMTKTLAKELGGRGITVNAIAPGMIMTEMMGEVSEEKQKEFLTEIPVKRAGKPEDVANAAAFFADPDSSYITGQVLCVDGGMAV